MRRLGSDPWAVNVSSLTIDHIANLRQRLRRLRMEVIWLGSAAKRDDALRDATICAALASAQDQGECVIALRRVINELEALQGNDSKSMNEIDELLALAIAVLV